MNNSKYIQVSSSVLIEYIYADQSNINTAGNSYRLSTIETPIWLLNNGYTNITQILNADKNIKIVEGQPIGTNNVRNRSFAQIKNTEGALLNINKIVTYNDFDNLLTNTDELPIEFQVEQAPVYDTIRIHLVQGFNFENKEGLTVQLFCDTNDNKKISLLNFVYNKTDLIDTYNPNSFFFNGRFYTSYIDIRVLSLYNLIDTYYNTMLDGNSVVEKITNGVGLKQNQYLTLDFSWIHNKKIINEQTYITYYDKITVDIPVKDQYEMIGAKIQESEGGDYIEFNGIFNGDIINQFISNMNSSGYDFILLHDLNIYEYIYDKTNNEYYWILTDTLSISQTDNYDTPNYYRPIIKNSSAISFKVDYTLRLYNRNDNTQIWKKASLINNSPCKYGKKLLKINLGTNPVLSNIYNQNIIKDITINQIKDPVLSNTKYITSFISNNNVSISYENLNIDSVNSESTLQTENNTLLQTDKSNKLTIYNNTLANILITDSTTYLKFALYQKNKDTNSTLNLTNISGTLYLLFKSNTNEYIYINEYSNNFTSKAMGEVVFKINSNIAQQILNFNDNTFQIILKNEKNEETFLYAGTFYNLSNYKKIINELMENNYKKQIKVLNEKITQLTTERENLANISVELSDNILSKETDPIKKMILKEDLTKIKENILKQANIKDESSSSSSLSINVIDKNLESNAITIKNSNLNTNIKREED